MKSRKEGREETLKLRKYLTQQMFGSFLAYVKEVNRARKWVTCISLLQASSHGSGAGMSEENINILVNINECLWVTLLRSESNLEPERHEKTLFFTTQVFLKCSEFDWVKDPSNLHGARRENVGVKCPQEKATGSQLVCKCKTSQIYSTSRNNYFSKNKQKMKHTEHAKWINT